jgi:hypothetical protein
MSEISELCGNQASFLGELMDKTKRVSKAHVSNIFFSKQNIFASRRETRPICKSKTILWKAMIIFLGAQTRGLLPWLGGDSVRDMGYIWVWGGVDLS